MVEDDVVLVEPVARDPPLIADNLDDGTDQVGLRRGRRLRQLAQLPQEPQDDSSNRLPLEQLIPLLGDFGFQPGFEFDRFKNELLSHELTTYEQVKALRALHVRIRTGGLRPPRQNHVLMALMESEIFTEDDFGQVADYTDKEREDLVNNVSQGVAAVRLKFERLLDALISESSEVQAYVDYVLGLRSRGDLRKFGGLSQDKLNRIYMGVLARKPILLRNSNLREGPTYSRYKELTDSLIRKKGILPYIEHCLQEFKQEYKPYVPLGVSALHTATAITAAKYAFECSATLTKNVLDGVGVGLGISAVFTLGEIAYYARETYLRGTMTTKDFWRKTKEIGAGQAAITVISAVGGTLLFSLLLGPASPIFWLVAGACTVFSMAGDYYARRYVNDYFANADSAKWEKDWDDMVRKAFDFFGLCYGVDTFYDVKREYFKVLLKHHPDKVQQRVNGGLGQKASIPKTPDDKNRELLIDALAYYKILEKHFDKKPEDTCDLHFSEKEGVGEIQFLPPVTKDEDGVVVLAQIQLHHMLKRFVGLGEVKNSFVDMAYTLRHDLLEQHVNGTPQLPRKHFALRGNAKTGKKEMGKAVAELLVLLKIIKEDKSTPVYANEGNFIARDAAQTASRTRDVISQASGGVLVINVDWLSPSRNENVSEAIGELKRAVLDHDCPVIIFCGQPGPVDDFLHANGDVARQIKFQFNFADYTPLELAEMYKRLVYKEGFSLEAGVTIDSLQNYFNSVPIETRARRNAGLAESFFLATKREFLSRMNQVSDALKGASLFTITRKDVQDGFESEGFRAILTQ